MFYFALLVSGKDTYPAYPDFVNSGPTHAEAYWNLLSNEKHEEWDYSKTIGLSSALAFQYVVLTSHTS